MQVADKLISGGIQVPISPSYSPCDLRQIVSFLRSCFLICPWKIMWWEPRVTMKIRWHNVCKSAVSPRRCLCKVGDSHVCIPGWSCWAHLWWGASHLILHRCWSGSKKRPEVGSERARGASRGSCGPYLKKAQEGGYTLKRSPHHRPPASVPSCPIAPFLLPRSSFLGSHYEQLLMWFPRSLCPHTSMYIHPNPLF